MGYTLEIQIPNVWQDPRFTARSNGLSWKYNFALWETWSIFPLRCPGIFLQHLVVQKFLIRKIAIPEKRITFKDISSFASTFFHWQRIVQLHGLDLEIIHPELYGVFTWKHLKSPGLQHQRGHRNAIQVSWTVISSWELFSFSSVTSFWGEIQVSSMNNWVICQMNWNNCLKGC